MTIAELEATSRTTNDTAVPERRVTLIDVLTLARKADWAGQRGVANALNRAAIEEFGIYDAARVADKLILNDPSWF